MQEKWKSLALTHSALYENMTVKNEHSMASLGNDPHPWELAFCPLHIIFTVFF